MREGEGKERRNYKMKMSIWTVEGRLERIKQKVSYNRLDVLKEKRNRQLNSLVKRYEGNKLYAKQVNRWKDKLTH